MDTLDCVAIYGAAVATGALIWNSIAVYRDRTCVKVKVSSVELLGGAEVIYGAKDHICITAMNKGRRPVTLSSAGLRLSTGHDLVPIPHQGDFPHRLIEGTNHNVFLGEDKLREKVKKLEPNVVIKFAWFRDETGRLYKTKFPEKIERDLRG